MTDQASAVTWAALLAHWTELAKAAVALPDDGDGPRWKRVIADVIALHAATQALEHLDAIAHEQRPAALDMAELICCKHAAAIHDAWAGEDLPGELTELLTDSRIAFEAAANAGVEWRLKADRFESPHAAALADKLIKAGFRGELFLPAPGIPLFAGAPVAFARGPGGAPPDPSAASAVEQWFGPGALHAPERTAGPRQVYRQMDFASGTPTRDLIAAMDGTLPPGQPLLVLAIDAGERGPIPLPPPKPIRLDPIPVEFDAQSSTE